MDNMTKEKTLVLRRMWQTSPELIVTAALMAVVFAGAIVGLLLDPTIVTGAPAWLKPAKFAVSIAIYTFTLAWIFTLIPEWTRTRRVIGWVTALTMVLEIAIICAQAWRGRPSHFNVASTTDATLFLIMGTAIAIQTLSTIAVAVALWRHRFHDAPLGWALRTGMIITIVGAMTGGMMTRPTAAQLAAARAGERMTRAGAHTIGGADGGPGLPGTGWSTEHGDVRVPHFIGLHALQVLAIFALLLAYFDVRPQVGVRLTLIAAASYATFYAILLTQALRGVSLVAPDNSTLVQLGAWAIGTVTAAAVAVFAGARSVRHTVAL